MATIRKYKTPAGEDRYQVRWYDVNGKQRAKSFRKFRIANEFRIKLENDMREGIFVEPSKITVRKYIEQWFETHKKGLQYKTVQGYEYNIKYINEHLGDKYLQRLTPGDIEKMYKDLSNLSGKYLQEIHSTLNLALKAAVRKRLLAVNPCAAVDRPKGIKYQAAFIPPEDVNKYLALFSDAWIYPAVVLALICGMRRGEILGLQWKDINYKKGEITVRHSVVEVKNEPIGSEKPKTEQRLKKTKNEKVRTINMPLGVASVLKQHRKRQLENKLLLGDNYIDSEFVLTEDNGKRPALSYISRFFNRRIKSSGLPHVRFHDLRHSSASLMLFEGVDVKTVSSILGHSSSNITMEIYAHVIDEAKKRAANSLEKYLK